MHSNLIVATTGRKCVLLKKMVVVTMPALMVLAFEEQEQRGATMQTANS
jgi:hypothetical protein